MVRDRPADRGVALADAGHAPGAPAIATPAAKPASPIAHRTMTPPQAGPSVRARNLRASSRLRETEREHLMRRMDDTARIPLLPDRFAAWFERRGWRPRVHQLAMIEKARAGRDALLIAPTGGGKTLAGFLPSLIELAGRPPRN